MVPQPQNPQSLNRYSYVLNNPVKYTDPTGHAETCGQGIDCDHETDQEGIESVQQAREASGIPVQEDSYVLPISEADAVRIPDLGRYGDQRDAGKHSGVDISVKSGKLVSAFANGVVVGVGDQTNGFGLFIVIRHTTDDGVISYSVYGHLQQQDVQVGRVVLAGDHIGLSDSTGNSTGPHLHFEIRNAGGFNEATNSFPSNAQFPYFPSTFQSLNGYYTSPAQLMPTINTAYGGSIENPSYQHWQNVVDRQLARIE